MRTRELSLGLMAWISLGVMTSGQGGGVTAGSAGDYLVLDDTPRDFTNLNAEAVRPLALSPEGSDLYALDTHGSQVVRFSGAPIREQARFDTPLFPVAMAVWGEDLLVVCEGTRCLVRMDRIDGTVRDLLALPAEPGDVVVDGRNRRAWVACAGADAVVQVDLASFTITRSLRVRSKRPRFLALEPDGSVLVTPSVSGNNSAPFGEGILDLSDPSISPGGGLPDADLFRLRPGDSAFRSVVRGLGSLLFAHGRNPATGEYWVLNVESLNADPARQGESAVRGSFARNRVSIAALPSAAAGALTRTIDLDEVGQGDVVPGDVGPGEVDPGSAVRYAAAGSVSQPFGLAFSSAGLAFLAAPSTDKVVVLDRNGARMRELILPDGAIPLATLLDERASVAWVHAWGSNRVYGFELHSAATTPFVELDLGFDPTPPSVRAGRRVFYDASFSADGRFTCNHCHPGGGADGLVWDLSDRLTNDKGPLVTQTLFGLESKFPYHWRGERALGDFNAAFRDLLGHRTPLSAEVFAALESFLFSLQQPANPRQDPSRRLVRRAGEGDPVLGQEFFTSFPSDGELSCNACHALPLGTTSDIIAEQFSFLSARTHLDPPSFGDGSLQLKDQPLASVDLGGFSTGLPILGAGLGARGGVDSLDTFVSGFPPLFERRSDVLAFLRQFDNGLSPAAQTAFLFRSESPPDTASTIESLLLAQARRGWIDVVAWGTTSLEGRERPVRWWFDPARERFRADDPELRDRSWEELVLETVAGRTRNVVQGLPPGNGRLFALERDGRVNGAGARSAASGGAGPVFRSPPRLLWANSTVAKLAFETEEPTDWEIRIGTTVGKPRVFRSRDRARAHTAVLQDLEQSTRDLVVFDYLGDLTVTDSFGKSASVPLPGFSTGFSVTPASSRVVVVGEAAWERAEWNASRGTLEARVRLRLLRKPGGGLALPAGDHVLVARLIVDGRVHPHVAAAGPSAFAIGGVPYDALSGPFLLSAPSTVDGGAADGLVELSFTASELEPGSDLVVHFVAIPGIDPAEYDPGNPDFDSFAPFAWSIPDTPPELRQLRWHVPGGGRASASSTLHPEEAMLGTQVRIDLRPR